MSKARAGRLQKLDNKSHPATLPHDASGRPRRTERETGMPDCTRRPLLLTAAMLLALLIAGGPPASAQTLKAVRERGTLNCGVGQGLLGFSSQDDKGEWTGLDVDICRAVAAAIFGDPARVTFTPLDASSRFAALASSKIDMLSRNSTWTMSRETQLGLMFAGVAYYDGQGFLLRREAGIDTALQLGGKAVCTQTGTTTELNLTDYFRARDMPLKVLAFATAEESRKAYDERKCDVLTSDVSQLYAERLKLATPDSHIILPEVISKEPLGPVVRQGDDQWFNLVKWTLYALINAEEIDVKSATIDEALGSANPDMRRLVGNDGEFGQQLGLDKDWAVRAIRAVGNYGEIFERNVGTGSRLSIPRGLNALWTQGGIQYAPPVR
jgi:general L-amino acid transport system substrate-binding protein